MASRKGARLGHMRRQRPNPPRLAELLRLSRAAVGLEQADLAKRLDISPRTLSRWEAGDARPWGPWRVPLVVALAGADVEVWSALVSELGLSLEALHARCPRQRELWEAKHRQGAASPEVRAEFEAWVRLSADRLDVTARGLRGVLVDFTSELERLGLSLSSARDILGDFPTQQP
jgi:transcriptional regulator with XRE-family HTH domain